MYVGQNASCHARTLDKADTIDMHCMILFLDLPLAESQKIGNILSV